MSDPQDHSESVEISSDDDGSGATTHTQVVENGKTVVDKTTGPGRSDSGSDQGGSASS